MKPIIILPPGEMSPEDIKLLRENELCVVEAKHPEQVKFVDPIPAASSRTQIESAAISLSRIILNGQWGNYTSNGLIGRDTFARIYMDVLMKGTELDPAGSRGDQEREFFSREKLGELQRLAKEEARAERAAAKASAAKGKA